MKNIEVNRTLYRFGECSTEIEGNTFKKGESVKNLLFSGIVPLHNVRVQSEEKIRLVRVENGEPGYEAGKHLYRVEADSPIDIKILYSDIQLYHDPKETL